VESMNLESVAYLPFNNFMHYLRYNRFDLSEWSGQNSAEAKLGGNCIYKSILVSSLLKSVSSDVFCVIDQKGMHHAILYVDSGVLYFFDPCLYMKAPLCVNSDFVCQHTSLSGLSDANFVALQATIGSEYICVWNYVSGDSDHCWHALYDFSECCDVPMFDWAVESFKPKPSYLSFRFFNKSTLTIQTLFMHKDSFSLYFQESFGERRLVVGGFGAAFKSEFFDSVGLEVDFILACMRISIPYVNSFERFF